MKEFHRLANDVFEVDEFEKEWGLLLRKFRALSGNDLSYLSDYIYSRKIKWAAAYCRVTFDAGINSTQRSESSNAWLKRHVDGKSRICEVMIASSNRIESEREKRILCELRDASLAKDTFGVPTLEDAAGVCTTESDVNNSIGR